MAFSALTDAELVTKFEELISNTTDPSTVALCTEFAQRFGNTL